MGFDDLFEQDHNHRNAGNRIHHEHDDYYSKSRSHSQHNDVLKLLLYKLQSNPKLKALLIIVAIIILGVVVFGVILFFPFILRLFSFLSEHGIQGVIDAVWKGSK